jgi:proline racemase
MFVVDTHTCGEPTRIILSGFPKLTGNTLRDKREFMQERLDHLRSSVILEPRGHDNQFGALVLEATDPEADYALLFMDSEGYLDMCGHATMGVTTALLELGIVEASEPQTSIAFETVAGIVRVKAEVKGGRVKKVSVVDVPSFHVGAFKVKFNEILIPVDVAYGGNYFVITEAGFLKTKVRKKFLKQLLKLGLVLRDEAAKQIRVYHPCGSRHPGKIQLAMLKDEPELEDSHVKNITIFGKGQFDRSPCGTGTAALVSTMYSKGLLKVGEKLVSESILNTVFEARILQTSRVGAYESVVPEITGRSFVTQMAHIVFHPDDPFKNGFSTLK